LSGRNVDWEVAMRRALLVLAGSVGVIAMPGVALASAPTIVLTPSSVHAGGTVTVSGSTGGGCVAGDQVTLISAAFGGSGEFAGQPAVFATSTSSNSYSTTATIPVARTPGTYDVTARCGGGNFGVVAHLQVLAPTSGSLPFTGAPIAAEIAGGLTLVAVGGGLVLFARRPKPTA
jgi:hypothetical protein